MEKRKTPFPIIPWLLSWAGFFYIQLVGKTSFIFEWEHPQFKLRKRNGKNVVYAFWHNTQVTNVYTHRNQRFSVIVSQSKDGEIIAQVMKRFGFIAVRGSSSRGGSRGFAEILDKVKSGHTVGVTPDGPRGPVGTVQSGVVGLSQMSGVPIVPIATYPKNRITFNSWDRFMVPFPFGVINSVTGKPIYLDPQETLEGAKAKVQAALNEVTREALEYEKKGVSWLGAFLGQIYLVIYNFLSILLAPALVPFIFFKFGFKRASVDLKNRLGWISDIKFTNPPLWFHSASVGEWQALKPFIEKIQSSSSIPIFITTSTFEAKQIISKEKPDISVSLLPVDQFWMMKKFIQKIKPLSVIVVETELWPNFFNVLSKQKIPFFIINGRFSNKSKKGWKFFKPLIRKMLSQPSRIMVRTEEDKSRFIELGAPSSMVDVTGNMKSDIIPISNQIKNSEIQDKWVRNFSDIILVGGSTWSGEEKVLLGCLKKEELSHVRLILAPRRLERITEIEKLVNQFSLSYTKLSDVTNGKKWDSRILLVDSLGLLKSFFPLADVAFVGGSLFSHGGHNPLEPAAAGLPLLFGPSMENFRTEAQVIIEEGGAVQVEFSEVLKPLEKIIQNESLRKNMGMASQRAVKRLQGATSRNYEIICDNLGFPA